MARSSFLRGCATVAVIFGALSARAGERPLREAIDERIADAWQREGIEPSPPADDAEFLRRVYLDLVGVIPSYEEATEFLADESPDKRQKLIDRLLEDPRYAQHQADVWDMILFGRNPPGFGTRERDGFQNWLRERFAQNTPYDEWAGDILRARGNTVDEGAPMYFVQYKNNSEAATEAVTQTFLGIQLQCARCHDHPYEAWSQLDFYGIAAFFARLEVVTVGKEGRLSKFAIGEKNTGEVLFTGPAIEQEPGKKGEPVGAKFLGGEALQEPPLPEGFEEPRNFPSNKMPPAPKFSRKDALADWIASPENPYFARAVANRVFAQFFGRGLVHPVDNMSESNEPSHPELLDELAAEMVEGKFDLNAYVRELANSRIYQLASTGEVAEAKPQWFQRARSRPLSAEELIASWRVATGYEVAGDEKKLEDRYGPLGSGYLLRFFGKPNNGVGDFQGGLHESLYMNNGPLSQLFVRDEGGLLAELLKEETPLEERVDRLFLSVLSRPPRPDEREKFVQYLSEDPGSDDRARDAMWVLLTCSEFRFNH